MSKQLRTKDFRFVNAISSIFLVGTVRRILLLTGRGVYDDGFGNRFYQWQSAGFIHNTVNICLFPPLFFFYGLYYTDVLSALSVLYAYQCYLEKRKGSILVLVGLSSLLFRQTNIFWVSLFLGGLAFFDGIPRVKPGVGLAKVVDFQGAIQGSWQHACAYDLRISDAYFEGLACRSSSIAFR